MEPLFSELDRRRLEDNNWLSGFEWYLEIDSTNRRAKECCGATSSPHLIIAESQTAGRGRGANRWWSGRGCLMFSLVLEPATLRISEQRLSQMSLATALAVAQVLTDYVAPDSVKLKWPNDVYVSGRKVCGILLEVHRPQPSRTCVVVGIGVNVSNHVTTAPQELQHVATSLSEHAAFTPTHRELLESLLGQMRIEFERLGRGQLDLQNRWSICCYLKGRSIEVSQPAGTLSGVCEGVDADGALLIRTPSGLKRVLSGESRLIRTR